MKQHLTLVWLSVFLFLLISASARNYTENFDNININIIGKVSSNVLNFTPFIPFNVSSQYEIGFAGSNSKYNTTSITPWSSKSIRMLNNISTQQGGILFHLKGCDNQNCFITPNTRLSFNVQYNSNSIASVANYIQLAYFPNISKIITTQSAFKMYYMSNEDQDPGVGGCYYHGYGNLFNYSMSEFSQLNHTNFYGTITNCSIGVNYTQPVNAFIVRQQTNTDRYSDTYAFNYTIDNLEIIGITDTTENFLPSGTISTNSSFCLNEYGWVDVPITNTYTDPEGDQILYGVGAFDLFDRQEIYQEDFLDEIANAGDYNVFTRGNINLLWGTCYSPMNFLSSMNTMQSMCPNNFVTILASNSNPMLITQAGTNEWYYQLNQSYNQTISWYNLFGFLKNNTHVKISLYDSDLSKMLNITLNKTIANELLIFVNDEQKYSGASPDFDNNYRNYFDMTVKINATSDIMSVYMADLNKDYFTATYSYPIKDFYRIGFNSTQSPSHWALDFITVKTWGTIQKPQFRTTIQNPLRITKLGSFSYNYYVTDHVHEPTGTYTENPLFFTVYSYNSPYCINGVIPNSHNQTSWNETGKSVVATYNMLKNAATNYIDELGLRDKGEIALYFLWLILFVVLIITTMSNTGQFSLSWPGAVSSLVILIVAAIFSFGAVFIVMLIILAFSVGFPLANHYLGGQ